MYAMSASLSCWLWPVFSLPPRSSQSGMSAVETALGSEAENTRFVGALPVVTNSRHSDVVHPGQVVAESALPIEVAINALHEE